MSMLSYAFITDIVMRREITKTSEALNNMREQIKKALRQTADAGSQKDGLDIALCALNPKTLELQFFRSS